jgi:hypothetical protein
MIVTGKIMDIVNVSDKVTQIVIRVKKEEIYLPVAYVCFTEIKALILQLRIEKGDFVKITYYLKSKKYNEYYTTSAIVEKICITNKATKQYSVDMFTGEIIEH